MLIRLLAILWALASCAFAQVAVKGYTRKDGTVVQPYTRGGTPSSKATTTGGSKSSSNTATTSAASTSTGTGFSSGTTPTPTLPPLDVITVGMSKGEVLAKAGNPNVQTPSTWVYTRRGKLTFTGDKLSSVESEGATTTTNAPSRLTVSAPATTTTEKASNSVGAIDKQKRNVTAAEKNQIYAEANIPKDQQKNFVIDHKVALELGGSNDKSNLQPQTKDAGKSKDQWENYLARQVKAGKMSLAEAQAEVQKPHISAPPK